MTKEETTIIKGIAILMMLFHHLFNGQILDLRPDLLSEPYEPLFYIGDVSVEYIITRFCRPVPFFFILSGYGISYLHNHESHETYRTLKRLLRIFSAYWISTLLFVGLGHLIGNENYPGDSIKLIANLTSYSNSYNLSMWFLFPYTLICLSSPIFLRLTKRKKSYIIAFIVTGLLYGLTGYIIKTHINEIGYGSVLGHLLQFLQYYFPFTCGVLLQKTALLQHPRMKVFEQHTLLTATLLIIVILIKSLINSQAVDTLYAIAFIFLFIKLPIHKTVTKLLSFIGKYSMVMWMVHMYLSHYFFTDFIYASRSSIIIFPVLVVSSFIISLIITHANNELIGRITDNTQVNKS